MLLQQFQQFVQKHQLIDASDKLLLAVSGGVDSMVLLNICSKLGYNFAAAHCNFTLRDSESDADETLVMETCKFNQIVLYSVRFNTLNYADANKLSIQMAARELRYNFFNDLINQHQFTKVLTAHHANDNIETLFINLLRSSGIQGLSGIPIKNENIIRPLLFATKTSIKNYATTNNIQFNEDSSNSKDDYLRNEIRHHLIPVLKKLSSNAESAVLSCMQHLNDEYNLLHELHQKTMSEIVSIHQNGLAIKMNLLKAYQNSESLLYLYLKKYGFNMVQIQNMLSHAIQSTGNMFYSSTHQVLVDRDSLILSTLDNRSFDKEVVIENIHHQIDFPISLTLQSLLKEKTNYNNALSNEAYFDLEKVSFPLVLRKWQQGDMMQPLGMKHKKKISDILIDNKVDLLTKEKTYVLCDANGIIIWLIGHRISDCFKVENKTQHLLYLNSIMQ